MSCVTEEGKRCTKCCEAVILAKGVWRKILSDKIVANLDDKGVPDNDKLKKLWTPISYRRAKKRNPYITTLPEIHKNHEFFSCNALIEGVGCAVRGTEDHPVICKLYGDTPDISYSPTCPIDYYRTEDELIKWIN